MADNGFSYEILFINDGSTDDSWDVIRRRPRATRLSECQRFRRNYGKSPALNTGFVRAQGDVIITMDADLQDSPDEIPALYDMIKNEGYDLVERMEAETLRSTVEDHSDETIQCYCSASAASRISMTSTAASKPTATKW